jgi:hypothetical protein
MEEQRRQRLFRFGCPGAKFDFTCTPPSEWGPREGGDGACAGKNVWSESSISHGRPIEEDVSFSLSDTSGSSCSSWFYGDESSPAFSGTSHHPSTYSENEQDPVYPNDYSKAMGPEKPTAIYVDPQPAMAQQSLDPITVGALPSEFQAILDGSSQASGVRPSLPSLMRTMIESHRPEIGTQRLDLPSSASGHCFPTF